uniref:Major facilitator superfamily (MFS) profile domain-containing protein n=1 Tax=Globodera rostochiensis TaxID=31243 RepID=A0A914GXW5_GLORO
MPPDLYLPLFLYHFLIYFIVEHRLVTPFHLVIIKNRHNIIIKISFKMADSKQKKVSPRSSPSTASEKALISENTPLLGSSSLPSVLTEPFPSSDAQADEEKISLSAEHLSQRPRRRYGAQSRHLSRRRGKRRCTHSDTDLRKMRPLILSPFMPTIATQVSINSQPERHRTATNASGIVPPTSLPPQPSIMTKVNANELESADEDEDESDSSSSVSSSTRFSELTKKQWVTIAMLAIANLCSTVAFSCIAPFYPTEAELKGMTTSEIGLVFGIFELVMFVAAPILGKYMDFIGSKLMFTAGLLITGITAIAFGFLNLLPGGNAFFWASLTIRCAEALGDACFVTSSFAISAKCFPGRIATIVGIMETFAGLGYTAGPVIGGVLYEYGGFQLPFFVLGSVLIMATCFSYYLIEKIEDEPTEDAMGMLGMLRIPVIWLMVFAVVICAISLSFFDPTLSGHLSSFNLSTIMVGLMFLLCGGFYCLTAPLWGLILDRWHCCNGLMFFGSTATIFSMFLVGPSPFIAIEKNLILIGISMAVLGIAAGALYIPTFQRCLDAVKEHGYDDSFQTYGCVSGVFQSAFAFGAFIGPTLGGWGVETIGFPLTTTIIASINIIFILALFGFIITNRFIIGSNMDAEATIKEEPSSLEEA